MIISCSSEIKNNEQAFNEITYFKDLKTNLCFAQKTSTSYATYQITSITCVPCDSLVSLQINK